MSEGEDLGRKLYEACVSGSVPALDSLIEKDELILNRVNSLTCFFSETPLHVAVLCGHLDFTKALLTRKPKLVTEFDTRGCSPLHLASIEGHVEIVQELLKVLKEDTGVCIARDLEGKIPLHLAAMKGRVEVIRELLQAQPKSINEKLDEKLGKGETVLHLCVKYGRLEALKTLFQHLQSCNKMQFLLTGDDDGNTILHLAVRLKQMETIKYLLGIQIIKDHANDKNKNGSTALDVVEHCRNKDLKTIEIRDLLVQAGRQELNPDGNDPPPQPQGQFKVLGEIRKRISRFWKRYFDIDPAWLKEVLGHLITAATVTATMAYQAILSPPGGVWQDFSKSPNEKRQHEAGDAIMQNYGSPSQIAQYVVINTVVLVASLSTIVLALSGFPLHNKFLLWVLIYTMYTTILFLAMAYFMALGFIFPTILNDYYLSYTTIFELEKNWTWLGVIGLVVMLHACHFLVWLWNKFGNLVKGCQTRGRGGANHIAHEKRCCWQP